MAARATWPRERQRNSLEINSGNRYGSNTKRLPKIRTLCELILENFEDKILQILLLAAAVSLVIGILNDGWAHGWVEGTSIFIAIFIIVSVTAGNNYAKEKQFQKLVAKAQEDFVAVFRGGEGASDTLGSPELVVGDVIEISSGMRIPADCVLISGTDIAADESAMTGEPDASEKQAVDEKSYHLNPNPFLLAKTLVEVGQGKALVCAVGTHARSSMAEEKISIKEDGNPLQ